MTDSSLNCAVLAVGDFPEGGATSQRLGLLARLLSEGVGECRLLLLHAASKAPIPDNRAASGEVNAVKFRYLNGRTVRPAGVAGALADTVRGIFGAVRMLVRPASRPDILVLYTPRLYKFLLPVLTARLLRIPVVTEVCEVYSFSTDIGGKGVVRRMLNSGDALLERLLPRISCGLLVISERIRAYYRERGMVDEAMYLLPVLIDDELYARDGEALPAPLQGVTYLLNSGAFNEKDGLDYLVRAVARVRGDYPDLRLVFTGHAQDEVRDTIRRFAGGESDDWIIFTGYLSRDMLLGCYRHAAGLLSCRSNSAYANYGFPTKLAEYLASGRPVVATTVGDVHRYLVDGESAFLARPEDVGDIAAALGRLLGDTETAARVGARGAVVARANFSYRAHIATAGAFVRARAGR